VWAWILKGDDNGLSKDRHLGGISFEPNQHPTGIVTPGMAQRNVKKAVPKLGALKVHREQSRVADVQRGTALSFPASVWCQLQHQALLSGMAASRHGS
jgi:hypothetical protein